MGYFKSPAGYEEGGSLNVDRTIEWLLEGPAWIQYRTHRDLFYQPDDQTSVQAARDQMLRDPQIAKRILERVNLNHV